MNFLDEIEFFIDLLYKVRWEVYEIYFKQAIDIEIKSDNSPVTAADKKASEILITMLENKFGIKTITEEDFPEWEVRKGWEEFFLIDPIDGTKYFISQDGEYFSLNIALIRDNKVVFGLIYNYITQEFVISQENFGTYYGTLSKYLNSLIKIKHSIEYLKKDNNLFIKLVGNRSFSPKSPENKEIFDIIEEYSYSIRKIASSAKFIELVMGRGDVYIRPTTIHEWDIAPADIILKEAGLMILDYSGEEIKYNKKEPLINGFIAGLPHIVNFFLDEKKKRTKFNFL